MANAYPALANHLDAPINTALILEHWADLLHLAASITTRSDVPSTILKQLAVSSKASQLAKALRKLGRAQQRRGGPQTQVPKFCAPKERRQSSA